MWNGPWCSLCAVITDPFLLQLLQLLQLTAQTACFNTLFWECDTVMHVSLLLSDGEGLDIWVGLSKVHQLALLKACLVDCYVGDLNAHKEWKGIQAGFGSYRWRWQHMCLTVEPH